MFTQKISMDCTKEQYEKYLKDELLKMGYKEIEIDGSCWPDYFVIVNNFGDLGNVTQLTNANKHSNDRHYIGSFNAPLFLALAAMTDRDRIAMYGEWIVYDGADLSDSRFWIRRKSEYSGDGMSRCCRKATKEEIMAKFGENKTENGKEIAEKLCLEAISLLKSKGYKILKPKTWEEI